MCYIMLKKLKKLKKFSRRNKIKSIDFNIIQEIQNFLQKK